ncbi:hypothetical protein DFH11DRAFT_1305071 [Phellopilus nigrolimitatus]|nr:hypothetical protein DFH11DRAFT_1305071 [Phellopilus nigrolimitatus]
MTVSSTLRPNSASTSPQNARPETPQSVARQEQCEAVVPARALEEIVPETNSSLQVQNEQTVIENNSQPSGLVQRNAQDEEDLEYFSNPEDNEAPPRQAEDAKADDAAHTSQSPIVNNAVIEDECRVALGNLKHPQLMSFSDKFPTDILYSRLGKDNLMLYPITSDAHIVKKEVSRSRFRKACGISQGPNFLGVPAEMGLGYSRVMFPILDNNPFLPQVPGAPGLYFASRDKSKWPTEKEMVVVRYCENKCNIMGEYDMKPTKPLSGSEFEKLPVDFRTAWVDQIRYGELGRGALIAIYLRNHLGREPSQEEIEIKSSNKSFNVKEVLSSDIEMAIIRGEEKINVWTMKCVGYDEAYKRQVLSHIHRVSAARKRRESSCLTEMLAGLRGQNLTRPSRREEKKIPFMPPAQKR